MEAKKKRESRCSTVSLLITSSSSSVSLGIYANSQEVKVGDEAHNKSHPKHWYWKDRTTSVHCGG